MKAKDYIAEATGLRTVKTAWGYIAEVTAFSIYDRADFAKYKNDPDKYEYSVNYGSCQSTKPQKTAKEAIASFWAEWKCKCVEDFGYDKAVYLTFGYASQYVNETL